MRYIFYILFVFLSACGPQPNTEPSRVEYKITPKINGFLVEINHNGEGAITRFVPETNAHEHESYQDLPRTQEYSIRYEILPKSRDSIVSDTLINYELGFFQTVGHGLLACIGSNTNAKKSIQIIWNAPDPNWKFANSFSANQTEQNFEASCHDLREALYVGGNNFTLHKTPFGALAIYGEEKFQHLNISKIENTLNKNMKRVENFWNAKADDYYFISIRSANTVNFGGTAQFQSFQLQLSTEQQEGYVLDRLITHEYFHHWNGLKITHKPNQAPLEHLDVWWFIEGFTDYYAYLLSAPDTKSYRESFTEPKFKNIALKELKRNYKTNADYFHVPYVQGRRLAAWLDKKTEKHSGKHLKNVMHELLEKSKDSSFFITQENFLKTICDGNYMNCEEARKLLQTYVIDGTHEFKYPREPLI